MENEEVVDPLSKSLATSSGGFNPYQYIDSRTLSGVNQPSGIPERTDIFPSINDNILKGEYRGQNFTAPIFAPNPGLVPFGLYARREDALIKQAQKLLETKQKAFNVEPPETYPLYQDKLNKGFYKMLEAYSARAAEFGPQGYQMLRDNSTALGRNFSNQLDNYKTLAREIKTIVDKSAEIEKNANSKDKYVLPETIKLARDITSAVGEVENNIFTDKNLRDMMSQLDTYTNLEDALQSTYNNIKLNISSSVGKLDPSSSDYYDVLQNTTTQYLSKAKELAKDLKQEFNLAQDEKFIEQHLKNMIQTQVKKDFYVANIRSGDGDAESARKTSAAADFVTTKLTELKSGGQVEYGKDGDYISVGRNFITIHKNGATKFVPLSDTDKSFEAVADFYSYDSKYWGADGNFTVGDLMLNFKNNGKLKLNATKAIGAGSEVSEKEIENYSKGNIIDKTKFISVNTGGIGIPGSDNILITGSHNIAKSGDKNYIQFFINKGGVEEKGIVLPSKYSTGLKVEGGSSVPVSSDYSLIQGAYLIEDGNFYNVFSIGGKPVIDKDGTNLKVPKSVIDAPINDAMSKLKNSKIPSSTTTGDAYRTPTLSGDKSSIVANEVVKNITIDDLKVDYEKGKYKNVFDKHGVDAKNIAAMWLTGFYKKGVNQDINEVIDYYNEIVNNKGSFIDSEDYSITKEYIDKLDGVGDDKIYMILTGNGDKLKF